MQGKLIVFEGIEGCGKTTQLHRLNHWLQEWLSAGSSPMQPHRIVITREPGGTRLGQALREILLTPARDIDTEFDIHPATELLLYAADRAQHVMKQIRPELESGSFVLCDRYTDSTIAYQGFGRGLDRATIDSLNRIATAGLQSHLTLWLDLDVERSLRRVQQRGQGDRIEQSSVAFHQRVRQGFASLAQEYPERIIRVDAGGSKDSVAASIQQVVQQRLQRWQTRPVTH